MSQPVSKPNCCVEFWPQQSNSDKGKSSGPGLVALSAPQGAGGVKLVALSTGNSQHVCNEIAN